MLAGLSCALVLRQRESLESVSSRRFILRRGQPQPKQRFDQNSCAFWSDIGHQIHKYRHIDRLERISPRRLQGRSRSPQQCCWERVAVGEVLNGGRIRVDSKSDAKHAPRPMSAHARIDAIDFWRGFALLTIFADHMPYSVLAHVTHHNFGLSDAAEAFVFLYGMSAALAYGPRFLEGRIVAGLRAVGRRLLTLYGVHILLSLLALGIVLLVALLVDDDGMEDEDRLVLSNPARGIFDILSLAHQIDFSNILPLYIMLLFAAPGLIMLARLDERLMLAASATVYSSIFQPGRPRAVGSSTRLRGNCSSPLVCSSGCDSNLPRLQTPPHRSTAGYSQCASRCSCSRPSSSPTDSDWCPDCGMVCAATSMTTSEFSALHDWCTFWRSPMWFTIPA